MSNIGKWWENISFYNKLKATLAGVLVIVEAQLIREDAHYLWHGVSVVCGIIVLIITNWFEDKNGNGKADIYE